MNSGLVALSDNRCDAAWRAIACLCFGHNSHPLAECCRCPNKPSQLVQIIACLSKNICFAWIIIKTKHVIGIDKGYIEGEAHLNGKCAGVNLRSLGWIWAPQRPKNHICWCPLVSSTSETSIASKRFFLSSRDWPGFVKDLWSIASEKAYWKSLQFMSLWQKIDQDLMKM